MKNNERLIHLERIRKEKGITLEDLSKLSGLHIGTIQKLECGDTPIGSVKLGTLMKLAKSLHCKVVDLLPESMRKDIK